jgi:hypothetical protein
MSDTVAIIAIAQGEARLWRERAEKAEAEVAALRKTIAAVKQATRLTYSWSAEGMQAAMGGDWVYRHGELRAALAESEGQASE